MSLFQSETLINTRSFLLIVIYIEQHGSSLGPLNLYANMGGKEKVVRAVARPHRHQ